METKRKTQHEIIDEIANFYNLTNRSTEEVSGLKLCRYRGENGKLCAFSRMMIDPSQAKEGYSAEKVLSNLGQDCLKKEYRGYNSFFYSSIQTLHDYEGNWMEEGLSEKGLEYVRKLKLEYNES